MRGYRPGKPTQKELEWERTFLRPNSVDAEYWETPIMTMDDLARELKAAMGRRHETPRDVAGRAGVAETTVHDLLGGRPADADTVLRILDSVKVKSPTLPGECMT